ncbi:MAG: M28 family peptidase, partial [Planctomycetia bacterium]
MHARQPGALRSGMAGLVLACAVSGTLQPAAAADASHATDRAALEARLREAVTWLAAPEREGRGPGTAGIEQAADWVARQLEAIGLDTTVVGEAPFQRFPVTLEAKLGPAAENTAELVGPPAGDGTRPVRPLALGTDFTPLAAGGSGAFDLPLVFAGYGITAPKEGYDDYAPIGASGAKGSAVIVLRQEPQKDNPHSVFDGNQASQFAALSRKVANASEHEAGGLVFMNDASDTDDALMAFERAGDGSEKRTMPVLHVRRSAIAPVIEAGLGRDLPAIERAIDDRLEPQSAPLSGWRIRGRVAIERKEAESRNVLAILPGTGGKETVVLGAHYDHLCFGGPNSAAPGETAVHHGADDNASGTAMLVEVARILAAEGPFPRMILF